MQTKFYVIKSLELHLFFGRIMKEHAFFLKAGFTPANSECAEKAAFYQKEFENLLSQTVALSDGIARKNILSSGEVVTEFTFLAEKQTQCLTGIPIDKRITDKALCLKSNQDGNGARTDLHRRVHQLNRTALSLLDGLISFQESISRQVSRGEMFTTNYPLLIEHIIREAKLYRKYVETLEREGDLSSRSMKDAECFWDQIMMEHAQFIRGLLDPSEEDLMNTADDFADIFCKLLEECRNTHSQTLTEKTLEETSKLRDFKTAGVRGIEQHNIRSIILPLLADHVLREANHYIRLLEEE